MGAGGKGYRVCQEVLFRGQCGQWGARRDILGHSGTLCVPGPSLLVDPIIEYFVH